MELKDIISKESAVNGLKSVGKLRIKISHSSIITFSALLLILLVAFTIRVLPMRWEIQAGSLHLSEFDPYHQYRFVQYVLKNGFISWAWPQQWVDKQRWYPDGINVAKASYPGLPLTAAFLYEIVSFLGIPIDLLSFCAIFPAIMGTLACLVIYFLGKDIGGKSIGLMTSLFLALSPSFIQRTSVGFFDDETIGIVALLLVFFLFLRAIDNDRSPTSSMHYSVASGLVLGYLCIEWGASLYPVGITVLFVFASILLKRYTQRLLLSFSVTFGIGLLIATSIPYLSLSFLMTVAILPVAGVFILLCLYELFRNLSSTRSKVITVGVFLVMLLGGFVALWQLGYMRNIAGKFLSVINPFERASSPLIESVAEHRISAWGSIYYELGIGIIFFSVGTYFVLRNLDNKSLFILIFSLTSLYFASSMVRLLVLFAPAFALLSAIGVAGILKPFKTLLMEPPKITVKKKFGLEHVGKEFSGTAVFLIFLILMTNFAFPMPKVYRQAYSPVTITAGSLPIAPAAPVQEWFDMLEWTSDNLQATTVVCSWWDYGYWLTVLGNVTSLADNGTINRTQIENVGFIFMANETQSLKMLKRYDAQYILVFTTFYSVQTQLGLPGTWTGYGDEGKWMWMARISGNAYKRFIDNHFIDDKSAWANETKFGSYNQTTSKWVWNDYGKSSTIYELMSWGKRRWCGNNGLSDPDTAVEPKYFDEAYFAGVDLSQSDSAAYGSIVPLVCLYKIDWQKYYADYPSG